MTDQEYLDNAGFVPARTTDPDEAFLFWGIDGAVILLTGRTDQEALTEGGWSIFGTRLLPPRTQRVSLDHPGAVATNTDPTQQGYDKSTSTLLSAAQKRLDVHTDGAMGFADVYPDLLALLCAQQASAGGESILVDGQYLIDAIGRDPAQRGLTRFLWDTPIEQCARMGDTPPASPGYLRSRRPVASRTPGGRLTVRYNHEHQRVLDDGPVEDHDRVHLATWHQLGMQAAAAAPRFLLQPGDLLVVDNYRVFHGREPYQGTDRYLHRALGFTDMSFRTTQT
ncbi:MAG: TauD/TfdA family dioxygenase [Pseudonocardiaceae bacterium]